MHRGCVDVAVCRLEAQLKNVVKTLTCTCRDRGVDDSYIVCWPEDTVIMLTLL